MNYIDFGAVNTEESIANFILDLVGYTSDKPLSEKSLLEPSFGGGVFLKSAISRLLSSLPSDYAVTDELCVELGDCIVGIELDERKVSKTRRMIKELLISNGFNKNQIEKLIESWLFNQDFLLDENQREYDFVVGNPPYVRQERISRDLVRVYRKRYQTIFDRADLYVPFFERSLSLLKKNGKLGFICADRWMKNKYGRKLRELIADRFNFEICVDMSKEAPFDKNVAAYPAITVISKSTQSETIYAKFADISGVARNEVGRIGNKKEILQSIGISVDISNQRNEPWSFEGEAIQNLIQELENRLPKIEEVGCQIGIGVATGADAVFIRDYKTLDVEDCRKLPLATTKDLDNDRIDWSGKGIINPFEDDGSLVDLDVYPKLREFFEVHREKLEKRHVAKKSPKRWYKTIDKIHPTLALKKKLLIPDIRSEPKIVLEDGHLYPHHNLYYILSDEWDLNALRAYLLSGIAKLFVSAYSTQLRGGYLRYQAQYLRKIRIPRWNSLTNEFKLYLIEAGKTGSWQGIERRILTELGMTEASIDTFKKWSLTGNGN